MEKAIYPRTSNDPSEHLISRLLPQTGTEGMSMDLLKKSEVVDGTKIQGVGTVLGHSYRWRLILESGVRSVAQVPDRFFDIEGRSYPIDWNSKVSVFNGEAAAYSNFKDAVIYRVGPAAENSKAKPYIIFDAWMDIAEHEQNNGQNEVAESLQKYLTKYKENLSAHTVASVDEDSANAAHIFPPSNVSNIKLPLTQATFLAIVVDNNDVYHTYVTNATEDKINSTSDREITWYEPAKQIVTSQFKGLDMWIRFESINEMIYFIITKYENDILSIKAAYRAKPSDTVKWVKKIYEVNEESVTAEPQGHLYTKGKLISVSTVSKKGTPIENTTNIELISGVKRWVEYVEAPLDKDTENPDAVVGRDTTIMEDYDNSDINEKTEGKLWAYVNPRTMKPFTDDYWMHQGEPYYIKSLTIAPAGKQIKGNKIVVKADQWPGMYMFVGETYIRDRDTGEDQRMQIKFPQVKVKSDQTITLEADGDPTTFNLDLEVAKPKVGAMMEITAYEIAPKMVRGENGCFYAVDGSSEVVTE